MANDNQNPHRDPGEWCEAVQTYKGKAYNLKEALLRSVSFWATKLTSNTLLVWDPERDSMVERPHPLYPEREELIQTCWMKISAARAAVEAIWAAPEPDGFLGVSRYVSRVCTNAFIDAHRRAEVRAPEIFAQDLDEPVSISEGEDGVNSDSGTFADTIPDSDGLQAFQFEDLRDELSPDEFSVLQARIQGATQAEIAEEAGESKSAIARTYGSAKKRARTWVSGLKQRTYHQTRAHLCARFTRNRCTRPDRLCGAELEAWNPANNRNVVEFHDESGEWHPPITNKPRVRAERECYNLACTQGGAVGPNNLVLPSSQSTSGQSCDFTTGRKAESCDFRTMHGVTWLQPHQQVVRYLPAITGEKNRPCEGCKEAAKRADHIPIMRDSFFSGDTRSINAETSNEGSNMDYKQAAAIIDAFKIPRTMLAKLADVHAPSLSAYLNGTLDLTQDKVDRIHAWASDVAKMIQAMGTLGIKVDLADVDNVRQLVQKINDAEKQLMLPLDDVLRDLPQDLPPLGSAVGAE